MNVSSNNSEIGDKKGTTSPSSSVSGCISTEDDSEEISPTYPSLSASENEFIRNSLNLTTSSGLCEAVEKCKELVLESQEWSDERKWLVHHLIELRMRLQEVEALESSMGTGDGNLMSSIQEEHIIMGHHLFLQLPANSTVRCSCCSGIIWSFLNYSYQCRDCQYKCHIKCLSKVKRLCTNVRLAQYPNYVSRICPEVGLAAQGYRCFECKAHITFKNSLVEPRQCDYDGRYYCTKCHWNYTAIIPARVIHNFDFLERPVCCNCYEFLKVMNSRPIINMDMQNPQLFGFVEEISNVKKLRSELLLMKQYLTSCPDALKKRLVWRLRPHLVDGSPAMFSLEDLIELHRGELHAVLEQAASVFTNHITQACKVCRGKGYYCELCKSEDLIFPFDTMISTCNRCSTIFHRVCYLKLEEECPKCKRKQNRLKSNDAESELAAS